MNQVRKEEIVETYERVFQHVWGRIVPTLGKKTVATVINRAIALTHNNYPFISHIQVHDEGLSFNRLRQNLSTVDKPLVSGAFEAFLSHMIDLLMLLTGDILVNSLIKEIEDLR